MILSRKWNDAENVMFTLSEETALPSFDARYQLTLTPTLKARIIECHYCTVDDCSLKLVEGCQVRCIVVTSEHIPNGFFAPKNTALSILASVHFGQALTSKNINPYHVKNSFFNQDSLQIQLLTTDGKPMRKELLDTRALNMIVLKFY